MTDTEMILKAIAGIQTDVVGIKSDIKDLRNEMTERFEEVNEKLEVIDEHFEAVETSLGIISEWAENVGDVTRTPFASASGEIK